MVTTKNKMDNPTFSDEEDTPILHQDEDYDNYVTPNTIRVDETSFTVPAETASTLRLRQNLKRDKIVSLYRCLDVAGDLGLADLDRFMIKKKLKNR